MSVRPVDQNSGAEELPEGLLEQLRDASDEPHAVRASEVDRMRSSVDHPALDRHVARVIATRLLELSLIS